MGICLVMRNNFKRSFHHKLLFTVTFLLPVLLCLLISLIHFEKTSIRVGILSDKTTASLEEVYQLLKGTDGLQYAPAEEADWNTELITGKFHIILDYRGSTSIVDFKLLSNQKEEEILLLDNAFRQSIKEHKPISLADTRKEGMSATDRNIAILLTLFMVLSTVHGAALIRDRQNGSLQRYLYSGRRKGAYYLGYAFYQFLLMLCQILLCMVVLVTLQNTFHISWLQGVVVAVVIAFLSTLFGELICIGCQSEVQANITASAITVILSLLGGTFVAVQEMPALLRMLSFASPIRWVVELMHFLITF